ncbi:MAG: MFS transporter [Pseudomonadota bacterium]
MSSRSSSGASPEAGERRLGWGLLLAYGALALPLAALNLPLYVFLPTFWASELGVGLTAVGLALLAARLLDVISDPLIGELSDRTRTRLGRRRPWVVAGAPILAVGMVVLFRPYEGAGGLDLFLWAAVAYLGWTMVTLPYTAWGAELSPDYHERTRITTVREAFVILGVAIAASLPALLGGEVELGRILGWMALAVIVILPVCLVVVLRFIPEPPAPEGAVPAFRREFRHLWANRPFRTLVLAFLLNSMANGLPATLFLLFASLRLEAGDATGWLLLVYFLAGVAAAPLWLQLSYRVGKHRAWILSIVWACCVFATVPLLGPGDVAWFFLICALSGASLGADLALPAAMQADVVDVDRTLSGRQRTGFFFAVWSMATKLSMALAVGIAFPVLGAVGFDPAGSNDATALWALTLLYAVVPIPIKLAAAWLVRGFALDAEGHAAIRERLSTQGPTP